MPLLGSGLLIVGIVFVIVVAAGVFTLFLCRSFADVSASFQVDGHLHFLWMMFRRNCLLGFLCFPRGWRSCNRLFPRFFRLSFFPPNALREANS